MLLDIKKVMIAGAEKKMNLKDIAIAAGITQQTMLRIKQGQAIRMKTAGEIAEVLGVKVAELLKS